MTNKELKVAPSMLWLENGEPDQFAHYLKRDRADLPMADFSDDALGNYLFMNYDRSPQENLRIILELAHGVATSDVPLIVIATAVKERLRWLARRLAVAEGRYPGMPGHAVSEMPELAMAGDEGGILTVNPDWCDWYESTYGTDTGSGFIKGKAIINQVLFAYQTVEGRHEQTSEAVREATEIAERTFMGADPCRVLPSFQTVNTALNQLKKPGVHVYYCAEEQAFSLDGTFTAQDLEALLFAARVKELAKNAEGLGNIDDVSVGQLRQVIIPGMSMTDVDSSIFSAPIMESYLDITGEPMSRFVLSSSHGGSGTAVKDLSVLRDFPTKKLLEISKWSSQGTPFGPELDEQLRGFTARDLSKVLAERLEDAMDSFGETLNKPV
jgi:hypothetical protein